eukprot:1527344-Pleurochrysis_carterae.AAC.1
MKRFDSSRVSGGGRGTVEVETEAEVAVAAGAALAPVSACERVCGPAVPAAACAVEGPPKVKVGTRVDGSSKVYTCCKRSRMARAWSRSYVATLPCDVSTYPCSTSVA